MMKIGKIQNLKVSKIGADGIYMTDGIEEVVMPHQFSPSSIETDQEVSVLVYHHVDGRKIASTETPELQEGEFGFVEIVHTDQNGAYCDWGVSTELFIPSTLQAHRLHEGDWAAIHMYYDEVQERLLGTTKINLHLKSVAGNQLEMGQEVDILITAETDLGYNVVIDNTYIGLIYMDDLHKPLLLGQRLKGYVKPIRTDGKIDITLSPVGFKSIDPNARKIMALLKENDGFLPYSDKSDPYIIREALGISKKLFKKAIGALYRERSILIKEDGIYKK